jgi:hypothetical protein
MWRTVHQLVGHRVLSNLGHVTLKKSLVSIGPFGRNNNAPNECTNEITPPGYVGLKGNQLRVGAGCSFAAGSNFPHPPTHTPPQHGAESMHRLPVQEMELLMHQSDGYGIVDASIWRVRYCWCINLTKKYCWCINLTGTVLLMHRSNEKVLLMHQSNEKVLLMHRSNEKLLLMHRPDGYGIVDAPI